MVNGGFMSFGKNPEEELEKRLTELGYSLVKLNIVHGKTRNKIEIIIYSSNGIKHSDCEKVSRMILDDPELDKLFGENYNLEVSSPGINRKLYTLREYVIFKDRPIEIALKSTGHPFIAKIRSVEGDKINLSNLKTNELIQVQLQEIQYAKLADIKEA